MSWIPRYLRSSIGAKQVMAITGLLLLLFAVQHMVSHLQMFGGPALYNTYANFMQSLWEIVWPSRIALLALVGIHVAFAISLTVRNRAARPVGYARYVPRVASRAGRAMALTGSVVFVFLAFHILHFTVGVVQPATFHAPAPAGHGAYDAYAMFVAGFQHPLLYAVYLAGIGLLSLHLGHGATSWLQSLGWRHPKYRADRLGPVIAAVLFVGYMLPPTAVLVGVIR